MIVRRGSRDDAAAASDIWARAQTSRIGTTVSASEIAPLIRSRLEAWGAIVLFGERDGEPVSVAMASPAREGDGAGAVIPLVAHISIVATHPDWWGHGYARIVLTEMLGVLRADGYGGAQLWTQDTNARAIALYRGLGFERTKRSKADDRGEIIGLYRLEL
jgi:ribosomal protein S18 acetylase RimI-like enzyme